MRNHICTVASTLFVVSLTIGHGCKKSPDSPNEKQPIAAGTSGAVFGPETSPIPPDLSKGWCNGHGVPESVCTRCDDSLIETFKTAGDWCVEHGLPETQCTKCHPEVRKRWETLKPGDKSPGAAPPGDDQQGTLPAIRDTHARTPAERCEAHGIPQNQCTRCNPDLIDSFQMAGDWCGEHGVPESQCPECNPALRDRIAADFGQRFGTLPHSQRPPSPACRNDKTKVRLATPEIAARTGLTYQEVRQQPLAPTVLANAEVAYNGNRLARLSSRVSGVVSEVGVDLGAKVRQGDVLAIIDAPELAAAKADMLQAIASVALHTQTFQRETGLEKNGMTPLRNLQETENRLLEARITEARVVQRLRLLGLSDEDVERVKQERDTTSLLPLTAPFDGEIIERAAVVGETVDPSRTLLTIADTTRMWAMLDLADPHVQVHTGLPVVLLIEGMEDEPHPGEITWVSTQLEARTRTLKVRAEVDNARGLLKANMFGRASIHLTDRENALVVSKQAVQWDGCCNIVFVKEDDTTFQPRKVRLGPARGDIFEVRDGVRAGEMVVVDGSFLLKTEILKSEIGAGCCPDDAKRK